MAVNRHDFEILALIYRETTSNNGDCHITKEITVLNSKSHPDYI
jgi:hypothetical protein